MISNKSTFFLGIFVFIIPFLGFPGSWKTAFIIISGITLIFLSVKISIPKKHSKARSKKEKVTPVFVENIPIYPRDNTVESGLRAERNKNISGLE
ncbi:MAG: hypothetical protein AB201_03610 [Parcubacteria bacterium C7867-006]|nr:MAG: hypothetical protein AB201_03610 [Parcubacteria bacterium C7867-006]